MAQGARPIALDDVTQEPVVVEVERALGPGIEFERQDYGVLLGRRARRGGVWLGFDRAAVVDSDDGHGRQLAVLVAVPVSTFRGCRLEVELGGGWETAAGPILVGAVHGTALPPREIARIAAGLDGASAWLDADAAGRVASASRRQYRERRSHARITGGRAWQAVGELPPELARYATPHSSAEYALAQLPLRFLRGLEGMLDDDERLLYSIERPLAPEMGIVGRLRSRMDRRSALLALTDRQLLWIVDHAEPNRQLLDWGVDVELVPVERMVAVRCVERSATIELVAATPAGDRTYPLPSELATEVAVMRDLLARFTPAEARDLPRRRYALEPMTFDAEIGARFAQAREARDLHAEATADRGVLGFLFSPRRPGQRAPAALVLDAANVEVRSAERRQVVTLNGVAAIRVTLSPLVGRISTLPGVTLSYPAPLMGQSAEFVRLMRRALACAT